MNILARLPLILLFLVIYLLLSACSDPAISSSNQNGVAEFELMVDKNLLLKEPKCFVDGNTSGALNSMAYVYKGKAISPVDVGGVGIEPLQTVPLTVNANSDYMYTVRIQNNAVSVGQQGNSVAYTIAIACDVSNDLPTQADTLTYVNHETYYVAIKSTVQNDFGLINEVNKPADHLLHSDISSGLVCNNCHFVSPNNDFLVTHVDHSVVTGGCNSSKCHADQQLSSVTHDSTAGQQDCIACHFITDWKTIR